MALATSMQGRKSAQDGLGQKLCWVERQRMRAPWSNRAGFGAGRC